MNEANARLQRKKLHLLWRAGFGPAAADPDPFLHASPQKLFSELQKNSKKLPEVFDVASPIVKEMTGFPAATGMNGTPDSAHSFRRVPDADKRRQLRRQSAFDIRTLSLRWLDEMTKSPAQLREKMALFWHGHFASKTVNIIYDQQLLQVLRENATGSFRELLMHAARSASLTQFLNNNQNRRNHPNENFARELMELFTLGRGLYTETDVRESARAFTGWSVNFAGEFRLNERQHDAGPKTFFGKTGNWSGEDILNIILDQPQCAVFITGKIYRFFVNEIAPPERITALANRFYKNGYDIADLLTQIFTSEWFYDQENCGNRIKSPVEWMVGMRRQLPMEWEDSEGLLLGRLLGQVLFNPPNVAGWPGGRHWINSSSLMIRLHFPQLLSQGQAIRIKPKTDDDVEMGMRDRGLPAEDLQHVKKTSGIRSRIDWETYTKLFASDAVDSLFEKISSCLLQTAPGLSFPELKPFLQTTDRPALIKSITLRLLGSPEYQLC